VLELGPLPESLESLELLELLGAAELLEDPGSLEDEEPVGAEDESDDPELVDAWEALPFPFPLPTPPLPLAEAPKALFPNDSRAAAASAAEPAQTDFHGAPDPSSARWADSSVAPLKVLVLLPLSGI